LLRVLPLGALQRAQLAPLGAVQPAFRLQLLQAIRRHRCGGRRLALLRVLPLGALQRIQLTPFGAAEAIPRLQLLHARALDGLLLRNGAGCAARRGWPGLHILLTPLDAACGPRRWRGALDGGSRTRGGSGDSRRRACRSRDPWWRHVGCGTGHGRSRACNRCRPGDGGGRGTWRRRRTGSRRGGGGSGWRCGWCSFLGGIRECVAHRRSHHRNSENTCSPTSTTPEHRLELPRQLPRRHKM